MPRSTLKLPAKSAAASGDSWSPPRKPLRGGIKGKKPAPDARAPRPFAAAKPAPARPGPTAAAPEVQGPRASAEGRSGAGVPRREAEHAAPRTDPRQTAAAPDATMPRKSYPKRGIARSTGARALPPARSEAGERPPRREADTASANAAPSRRSPQPPATHPEPRATRPLPPAHAAPPAAQRPSPQSGAQSDTAPRRALPEPPRLAKRVSEMALCSRRQADEWIENGWVSVDGVVTTTLGARVHPKAKIEIKEDARAHHSEAVTILFNWPAGEGDDSAPLIRADNRWREDESRQTFKATHLRGLAPAGRLDAEACGMLVLTQEGSVARRITGDDTRLEKEYMVRVVGQLDAEGLQRLNHGLELDGVKLKRAQVSWQNEEQLRFVLHESRKQQIARMCELVGLRVAAIKRIRIGSVSLGKLPEGQWRYLRDGERF